MRYKKGTSGNPNGRPKGALNKSTNQVRDILTKAHANNFDFIMEQINEMTKKERLQRASTIQQRYLTIHRSEIIEYRNQRGHDDL